MSDSPASDTPPTAGAPIDPTEPAPELVMPDDVTSDAAAERTGSDEPDAVTEPAKVMRIGSMIKLLLEEVRATTLDEASRERLAEVYERSVTELSTALSPDLQEELRSLTLPFEQDETPSEAEIRVAKAQLVGWLEGLFHGIQASLMAQQFAARQQLQGMRQLPDGLADSRSPSDARADDRSGADRPGTYL